MGENSKIEWTDHTFNPWIGCTKVGAPCDNCYAEALVKRYGWATWGPHGERKRTSQSTWNNPIKWARAAAKAGVRRKLFCCSLADWLDNKAPQAWREDLGRLIVATPQLDWLLLTKRIQNYDAYAPWPVVPPNVWLGITCGDQKEWDRDWPKLAAIPATVRFISYEPALGPIYDLTGDSLVSPDWIICGGESGAQPRHMDPMWARSMRDNCKMLGISFFMKQMTGKKPIPPDLMVRQYPRIEQRAAA